MKKRNLLWTMAAAVALASCSETELVETPQVQEQNAITFDTYVGDNAQSRATVVDDAYIKTKGFGVNAYYTGTDEFDSEETYSGNAIFMNNTKVTFNEEKGTWTYSPVKYWPNNQKDKVSFFAYAPYVSDIDSNSDQIDFLSDNNSKLTFYPNADAKLQVDLIYHKANGDEDFGYEKTIDLEKPTINKKIKFNFQHALSRIAFDVKAVVDETDANGDNLLDGNTRINIKRVALVDASTDVEEEGLTGKFYTSANLDLIEGVWDEKTGEQPYELTGTHFYRTVKAYDAENEEEIDVVQLTKFNPEQCLLNDESYLMIIPQDFSEEGDETTSGFRIYIEYDVISEEVNNNGESENTTNDSNTITNKIYSETIHTTFQQGKAYKFRILLGMTSVKLEAEVNEWGDEENEGDYWMPENGEDGEGDDDNEDEGDDEGEGDDEEAPTDIEGIAYDATTNTFSIGTADELATLAEKVNNGATYEVNGTTYYWNQANYIQTAIIDLSTVCGEDLGNWTPIGLWVDTNDKSKTFEGTYDGQGYSIKNLYINDNEANYLGLFGYSYAGSLSNVHIESGSVVSSYSHLNAGGIVGAINDYATITSCSNNASVSTSGQWSAAGGIAGSSYGKIIACYNMASITGGTAVGGISGYSNGSGSTIYACYNTGEIKAEKDSKRAGGIVGNSNGTIVSCYNKGTVEGSTIGGIAGELGYDYYEDNYIQACYYGDPCTTEKSIGTFTGSSTKPDLSYYTDVPETATTDWEEALTKMNAQLTDETGNYGFHYENEGGNIVLKSGNAE